MMKYILIILLIKLLFLIINKNNMLNILFQNMMIMLLIFFIVNYSYIKLNMMDFYAIYYDFGLDFFSFWMINLSIWIILLMMLASLKVVKYKNFLFLFVVNLMFMLFFLVMSFSVLNLLMFYIMFEASLIPTLFLILGWGYQIERIEAGMYMMLYTLVFSLPFLLMMFYMYHMSYSLDIEYLNIKKLNFDSFLYNFVMMIFFVKIPMFSLHGWLPKAHVEAPVSGSMILAGVMLKLGGYGIYRLMFISENLMSNYMMSILVFSLVGSIYLSLVCLRQVDMKSLVAYSSVVHMGLVIGGLFSLEIIGVQGAFLMMISHGLCSSGLFCLVNMFYERSLSRSLIINKGMLSYCSPMMMMWFLLCMGNMSAPPSLNLISEIFLLMSLLSLTKFLVIILMLFLFFSSCYSLYLYSYVCYGKSLFLYSFTSFSVREFFLILMHLIPLNLMILKIDIFY
ncbi:NADH dehydrogenase subunit 4 (mitochondrion) [Cephus cinctus]|uniref:NADH-ubiquinone oxidoreductase chain 4 n=1 Tax=Cephus cinctus TaxID=211228 RepID=C4NCD8_CEPCN|nr:NADH dehydrogenase subunit 4 [Cephus cinctus]ACJ69689.1 NADH dehydrogenase subunit 4 [Cephus cinctus]